MKPDIHPKYFPNARVICACGHTWTTGATQAEIRVDVCSNCHPFYTGEQRIVDTAGRVDRFRMRLAQKREEKTGKKQRKQKVLVIGPDEETRPAEPAVAELPTVDVAPAEPAAEVAQPEPVMTAPAVEPELEVEREPEVRKRTVVESADSVLPMQPAAQADLTEAVELPLDEERSGVSAKPRRTTTARKPRAPRAARAPKAENATDTAAAEKPARKPRTRKTAEPSSAPPAEPAQPSENQTSEA
jgi:large subunit ribosomal protein L31